MAGAVRSIDRTPVRQSFGTPGHVGQRGTRRNITIHTHFDILLLTYVCESLNTTYFVLLSQYALPTLIHDGPTHGSMMLLR